MPAIAICSAAFLPLGKAQAKALGYPDLPIVVIPHPFGLRTRDEVKGIAAKCAVEVDRIVREPSVSRPQEHIATSERAARLEAPEDQESFDAWCRERRWSDGLPLVPPTISRVERMMKSLSRAPDELIAHLPPAFGAATIERIAVNAAMAGCAPQHMPVLIAAVQAVADPAFNLQAIQATTNPATPWVIINGPIARELGINAGSSCLGPGSWANATLGRALRLILQNVGGALPGDIDRATAGQPGKYTFCCAENEEASPWEPLHVERGFAANASTVTVVGAAGTLNMNTHTKDANDLVRVLGDTMAHPTSNDYWYGGEPWLILSPEHAEVLKLGGLSKADFKRKLWEASKMAASRWSLKDRLRVQHTRGSEFPDITPDTLVPVSSQPNGIGIIVAGGAGTHSVYVPAFGNTRSVTREISKT